MSALSQWGRTRGDMSEFFRFALKLVAGLLQSRRRSALGDLPAPSHEPGKRLRKELRRLIPRDLRALRSRLATTTGRARRSYVRADGHLVCAAGSSRPDVQGARREFVRFQNTARPRRAPGQHQLIARDPQVAGPVERTPALGGIHHNYRPAA